jgi:manganese/zinc/iron transport system substrate-binding protein
MAGRLLRAMMIGCLLLAGCTPSPDVPLAQRSIRVLATTTMIADAVRQIGGDAVTVDTLMGPGIDPHRYVPSAGDIDRIDRADIVFHNGLHLEGKMADVLASSATRPAIAVSRAIPPERLLQGDEGEPDPHFWFDIELWKIAVETVRDELARLDPARANLFRSQADRYRAELDQHAGELKQIAEKLPRERRVIVTAHDAFGYLGRLYGFEVHGLQGISTAGDTSSQDVSRLATLIGDKKVPVIFGETSVPDRGIRAVQEAVRKKHGFEPRLSAEQLFSDALGEPTGPGGTYLGMLRHNITTLVAELSR